MLLAQNRMQSTGFLGSALIACGRARLPASRAVCEPVCDTACGETLFAESGAYVFTTVNTKFEILEDVVLSSSRTTSIKTK